MTGKIKGSGNIQSLLNYIDSVPSYGFFYLFNGCASLVNAPALPAKTISTSCYQGMFSGCTSLTQAPALRTKTLAGSCYRAMFQNCSSLVNAPALPALTLASYCYNAMFQGCTNLVNGPATLPAQNVLGYSYNGMFLNCTGLKNAPSISGISMGVNACQGMFQGCTSLVNAPALHAQQLAQSCYQSMFSGCTSLITAPALPATTLAANCYYFMFDGCSSLENAPAELPATALLSYCYAVMFRNCKKLVNAPVIKATSSVVNSLQAMFQGCSLLDNIEVNFSTWVEGATGNWLSGVSASGTFTAPAGLEDVRGVNNIPDGWTFTALPFKSVLSYLESTGTQYINTAKAPDFTNGDAIEAIFYKPNHTIGDKVILGSREQNATNGLYINAVAVVQCDTTGYITMSFPTTAGDFTVSVNDKYIKINNTSYSTQKRMTCAYNLFLFSLNNGGSSLGNFDGVKFYDWKYYHNGALIQHLIPALDTNDVPCMYDLVSKTCVYNAGTGDFIYG